MQGNILPGNKSVGQPLDRIDGVQKVTGAARYSAEFALPNLAYAVTMQSTIANGRITAIDTHEAEAMPGVLAAITHLNAPKLNPFPEDTQRPGKPGQKLLPLQGDRIYYSGQHIGLVVAETFEQAMQAAHQIKVSYQEERPITEMERHLDSAFGTPSQPGRESNDSLRGDPDMAMHLAEVRVDQIYRTPVENHNPMEPSATIAAWSGDRLTLYDATQWVSGAQNVVAALLGISAENVRTISYFLGGGFGCKGFTWPHTVMAAMAARKVGRPVKLELTRQQMFSCVGYRAQTRQRVALGANRDGRLAAVIHDTVNLTSPYDEFVEKCGVIAPMLYMAPNARAQHKLVRVNRSTPTSMRAPGEAPGSFALESAMDELAYALKLDPIELRLRNYTDNDPSHQNRPWSSKALRECYALGAEKFGWKARNPQPRATRDGDLLIGWGMATATYPMNRSQAEARVEIFADGRARAVSGTQDLGTGTYTTMTQITADALGLPVRSVHFELGDSSMPQAPVSGGSQTSASVGSAVKTAAQEARLKAIRMAIGDTASPLYGQSEDQIEVINGRLALTTDARRGETYADLLKRHNMESLTATGSSKPGQEKQQYSMHAHGAQFAEVKVNMHTGETRVTRMVGAFAAGRILNEKTAHSQLMGGMVWGIGMALLEQTVTDTRLGRIMNADLAEYHVPTNRDVPAIEAFFVDEIDPYVNPVGAKGIGELGIVGSAAAVANAIYHATGRRIRDLPITPDKLI